MGEEGKTFNTKFGCENIPCRLLSSETLEMPLTLLLNSIKLIKATTHSNTYKLARYIDRSRRLVTSRF
jgi:hypothetical protein